MNVIADASTIECRVIFSENLQPRPVAGYGMKDHRNQMSLWRVQLADFAGTIGAGRIEVAQGCEAQAVRGLIGLKRLFKDELGDAVRDSPAAAAYLQ